MRLVCSAALFLTLPLALQGEPVVLEPIDYTELLKPAPIVLIKTDEIGDFYFGDEAADTLAFAFSQDKRHPTLLAPDGVWHVAPNLVGHSIQLAFDDDRISGRGYKWGCCGNYESFELEGTRSNSSVELTFKSSGEDETILFKMTEIDGVLQLKLMSGEGFFADTLYAQSDNADLIP